MGTRPRKPQPSNVLRGYGMEHERARAVWARSASPPVTSHARAAAVRSSLEPAGISTTRTTARASSAPRTRAATAGPGRGRETVAGASRSSGSASPPPKSGRPVTRGGRDGLPRYLLLRLRRLRPMHARTRRGLHAERRRLGADRRGEPAHLPLRPLRRGAPRAPPRPGRLHPRLAGQRRRSRVRKRTPARPAKPALRGRARARCEPSEPPWPARTSSNAILQRIGEEPPPFPGGHFINGERLR